MRRRARRGVPTGRRVGRPYEPHALVNRIAAYLAAHPGASFRAAEIAAALSASPRLPTVRALLRRLCTSGRAARSQRGRFHAPAATPAM